MTLRKENWKYKDPCFWTILESNAQIPQALKKSCYTPHNQLEITTKHCLMIGLARTIHKANAHADAVFF